MSLNRLQERKAKLKILILGAYRPKNVLKRLECLRDCLIRRKFDSARLVKDFPDTKRFDEDDDIHFTKKSRWFMNHWAHLLIFVFFSKGENLGVGNELSYTCLKLPIKTSYSAVLLEASLDVGSQIRGTVKLGAKNQKLSYENFQNDKELCDLSFGHCRKVIDQLFYYID